jgi:hypothetical protein
MKQFEKQAPNRRSFLKNGMLAAGVATAGVGMSGRGVSALGQEREERSITKEISPSCSYCSPRRLSRPICGSSIKSRRQLCGSNTRGGPSERLASAGWRVHECGCERSEANDESAQVLM